jgi:hypothetical protein
LALDAQTKRLELLRKRFEQVEKDYLRKMTEMEKGLYKSPLIEDKEEWKTFIDKSEIRLLSFMKIDSICQSFMTSLGEENNKKESLLVLNLPTRSVVGKVATQSEELAELQFHQQL